MRVGLLVFVALAAGQLFLTAPKSRAQEFNFGTDLVDGVESGRSGGGWATGYMNFAIDGNQLTAVLRNTSPDQDNFANHISYPSPAIRRFDFELQDITGSSLSLLNWELTAFDEAGDSIVLGNSSGVKDWKINQPSESTFRLNSRGGKSPNSSLYSPQASGGFAAGAKYFTEAILVATFNATIGSRDVNPELRFEFIGSDNNGRSLTGVRLAANHSNPEPSSLIAWTGLLALTALRRPRRRS